MTSTEAGQNSTRQDHVANAINFSSAVASLSPQECYPNGYTPVTASTAVTLGNLLMKRGAGTDAASAPHATQARLRILA